MTQRLPEIAFVTNRVLGNIGAPLDPNQWDEEYDVEGAEDHESEELDEVTNQQHAGEEGDEVPQSPTATASRVSFLSRGSQSTLSS